MSQASGVSSSQQSLKRAACCSLEDPDCHRPSRRARVAPLTQIGEGGISDQLSEIEESDGDANIQVQDPSLAHLSLHPTTATSLNSYKRPSRREDFQIAIICALPIEYNAVCLLIDQYWDAEGAVYGRAPGDNNHYRNGRLGKHNVVLVQLTGMGKSSAAGSTASLRSSYYNIRLALLVGICGGVPEVGGRETLLGDVVIGEGIFQYDFGRQYHSKHIPKAINEGNLGEQNKDIRGFIQLLKSKLGTQNLQRKTAIYLEVLQKAAVEDCSETKYCYPGCSQDKLFEATYQHKHRGPMECDSCSRETDSICRAADATNCAELGCDEGMLVRRQRLIRKQTLESTEEQQCPEIFIGHIASGDTVMRSSEHRDAIAKSHQEEIIAFEMEGAGAFDEAPSIVIKGICDYADSHKNKEWQPFAAATAAAAAKAVLERYPLSDIPAAEAPSKEFNKQDHKCLTDLYVTDPADDKTRITETKGNLLRDSYIWILQHADFKLWRCGNSQLLWITGDPGKGKTMLLCGLIDELSPSTKLEDQKLDTLLSYFLFEGTDSRINNPTAALRGLIFMLVGQHSELISYIRKSYDNSGRQLFEGPNAWFALSKIFAKILKDLKPRKIYIIVDAIDECTDRIKLLEFIVQSSTLSHVKWIISSRNTPDIHRKLTFHTSCIRLNLELESNAEYVSQAVDTYIKHSISGLSSVFDDEAEKAAAYDIMRRKANGTFLWVSIVTQELKLANRWNVQTILDETPPDLREVYRRMIHQVKQQPRLEDQRLCSVLLSTLVAVYRPLHLEEVAILPQWPENIPIELQDIEALLNRCGLFFTIRDDYIYIIHQSAMDFLSDEGIGLLLPHVRNWRTEAHRTIFLRSLKALSTTLRRNIYNIEDPGFNIVDFEIPDQDPLTPVQYSCVYWIDHLNEIDGYYRKDYVSNHGKVDSFLRKHFLHWVEAFCFIDQAFEGIRAVILLESMVKPEDNPGLHSLIHDARRFLLYSAAIIEETPLQIYFSALSFAPSQSLVRKQFGSEILHHVDINPLRQEWGPLLQTLKGHEHPVHSVAFSPDGKTIASASDDGRAILWDSMTGMVLKTLEDGWLPSWEVAFSSDGKKVVSILASSTMTALIWDSTSGVVLDEVEWRRPCCSRCSPETTFAELSHSGETLLLAVKALDYEIRIWDIPTKTLSSSFSLKADVLALSPDGRTIAYLSNEGLKLWDIPARNISELFWSDNVYQELDDHDLAPTRLISFSPNGKFIASTSNDTVRILDAITGKSLRLSRSYGALINAISFSPDNRILACALEDTVVKLWDVEANALLQSLEGSEAAADLIIFSPDSKMIATTPVRTGAGVILRLWDTATGDFLRSFEEPDSCVSSMAFWPDGETIALASGGGRIRLWNIMTGEMLLAVERQCSEKTQYMVRSTGAGNETGTGVSFSPNGRLVASSTTVSGLNLGFIRLWDQETATALHTLEGHGAIVGDFTVFSPNGKTIAAVFNINSESLKKSSAGATIELESLGATIYLWDVAKGALLHRFKIPNCHPNSMTFSPDGCTIALLSNDGIIFSDTERGSIEQQYKAGWSNSRQIVYSPCGKTITSLFAVPNKASLGTIYLKIWDISAKAFLETHTERRQITIPLTKCAMLTLSPDRKKFSVVDSKVISIYDATTGATVNTFVGHNAPISSMAFSPSGNTVISGSLDLTVRVWELETTVTTSMPPRPPDHDTQEICTTVISQSCEIAASLSVDLAVKLWDTETGACLFTDKESTDEPGVRGFIKISPEGTRFAYALNTRVKLCMLDTNRNSSTDLVLFQRSPSTVGKFLAMAFSLDSKTITLVDYSEPPFDSSTSSPSSSSPRLSYTYTLRVYDALSGSLSKELPYETDNYISNVALSPNGELLAMLAVPKSRAPEHNSSSTQIEIRTKDFILLHTLQGCGASLQSPTFSPDGRLVISPTSDDTYMIWDVLNGAPLWKFKGHEFEARMLAALKPMVLSPVGKDSKTDGRILPPVDEKGPQTPLNSKALFVITDWIAQGGRKIFRLPSEYKVSSAEFSDKCLILGTKSGQVLFIRGR
ncbi:hypothetical protein TWF281_000294 [Arthrobotrys megalospora]